MANKNILAFSSSRTGNGGYLEKARPVIQQLLGDKALTIAFIPFASVSNDYEQYGRMVATALEELPYHIKVVQPGDAKETIQNADVIMTGGGNSFKLLHDIYAYQLLNIMRDKINNGTPYIGWSAGANITGPGIGTTNDMPIIMPESFTALHCIPVQINPHYNNYKPEGHNGETRDQRLEEFVLLNPGLPVVALPEGCYLQLKDNMLQYFGDTEGYLFSMGDNKKPSKERISNAQNLIDFL